MEKGTEKEQTERLVKINLDGLALSVTLSDFRSGELAGIHYHSSLEIHMMQTGTMRLYAQGCEYELSENTCCLVGANVYHYLKPAGNPDGIKRFSMRFECRLKKGADKEAESLFKILSDTKVAIFEDRRNILRFSEIEQEIAFPKTGSRHILQSLLAQIIVSTAQASSSFNSNSISSSNSNSNSSSGSSSDFGSGVASPDTAGYKGTIDDFRERIISDYICDNIKEELTPETLAGEIAVSVRHLNRIIRRLFGKPFKEVLIETRLEAAKDLLKNTDKMVDRISEEVGYKQPSDFYRVFRKRTGMTPGQYRKLK